MIQFLAHQLQSLRPRAVHLLFALALATIPAEAAPQASPDKLATAAALIDVGDPEQAVAFLDRWIKKHPKDAQALLLRSTARFMLGEVDAGKQDLDKSIRLAPENRQAWLNRAALAVAEEAYSEALEALGRAETLAPEASDNSLNIGAVLLLLDRFDEAAARFRTYLVRNPGDPQARYLVASNYAMRGFAKAAVANLERAIALDEKARRKARTDPNFAPLDGSPVYQKLLDTDRFRHPSGSRIVTERYEPPYNATQRLVLDAVISSLQIQGRPFDPQVEAAPSWALIWSDDLRIKVAADGLGGSRVELSALPGRLSSTEWQAQTTELLRGVAVQLHARNRRLSKPDR